jgi:hypothetical protein
MAENELATMPVGSPLTEIRESQVQVTKGNEAPAIFEDDAAATLVWENYQQAKNYVENNTWLLDWQETDLLYQSPTPNRAMRVEPGRPARVSRFLVAKFTRTLARAVKRGLFAEQYPFFLRPTGKTTQEQVDAWTTLIGKLLKRMKFRYHVGLLIDCQTLQGTGIGKPVWQEKKRWKKRRERVTQPTVNEMPDGSKKEFPTKESDEFKVIEEEVTESWPFFEYRRLGTTLFDPKWCTPDAPEESAGYVIDINYVSFGDLQEMQKLDCYKNIPSDETLKRYFFGRMEGGAPIGSQLENTFTAQGSMVTHAEGRNRDTDKDPLKAVLMLLEQWDEKTVKALLVYDGRKLIIRNEEHQLERIPHVTATWWPVDNCGYGMGIGKLNGSDQRINQGVINECLKMIAYPFNAPLIVPRGDNAPTQNVINRMGGFWALDIPSGGDFRKSVGFMPMPEVPQDAWKMLELSQKGGEDLSGANSQMQQGNLGGPGSSAARTATGASRIAGMADQNVADPIDSVAEGVIIPTIEFLVKMVKEKMPLAEIRDILSDKHAAIIEKAINQDQFLNAEFEVDVLAGQKLMARQGIQQLIPMFLQILQQPQLLEYLHQRGDTIDFKVMLDLMMQVSELTQQPDIFRKLTPKEQQNLKAMNPGMQKVQAQTAVEQVKGANKKDQIQTQGQVDLANKAAEIAMEKQSDGIPLERASGRLEEIEDKSALQNGLPDQMQQ